MTARLPTSTGVSGPIPERAVSPGQYRLEVRRVISRRIVDRGKAQKPTLTRSAVGRPILMQTTATSTSAYIAGGDAWDNGRWVRIGGDIGSPVDRNNTAKGMNPTSVAGCENPGQAVSRCGRSCLVGCDYGQRKTARTHRVLVVSEGSLPAARPNVEAGLSGGWLPRTARHGQRTLKGDGTS